MPNQHNSRHYTDKVSRKNTEIYDLYNHNLLPTKLKEIIGSAEVISWKKKNPLVKNSIMVNSDPLGVRNSRIEYEREYNKNWFPNQKFDYCMGNYNNKFKDNSNRPDSINLRNNLDVNNSINRDNINDEFIKKFDGQCVSGINIYKNKGKFDDKKENLITTLHSWKGGGSHGDVGDSVLMGESYQESPWKNQEDSALKLRKKPKSNYGNIPKVKNKKNKIGFFSGDDSQVGILAESVQNDMNPPILFNYQQFE